MQWTAWSRVRGYLLTITMVLITGIPSYSTTIEGTSSGIFVNPAGPAGMIAEGTGTDTFAWGIGDQSYLDFSGSTIRTEFDTIFSFGTLSYYNGSIVPNTHADSVDLSINLNLISPAGINQDFSYNLSLINTPNTGDPYASADYVTFPSIFPASTFSYNGTDYTLGFIGFGEITNNGFSMVNEFHVMEGCGANAQLLGKITENTNVVPEPSTFVLFGGGIAGLALYARKRKKD